MSKRFATFLIAIGVLLAIAVGVAFYYNRTRVRTIVIATNKSGTESYELISALKQVTEHADPRLKIQIKETGGSVDILQQLAGKEVDFGVAQLDALDPKELQNIDTIDAVAFLYPQVYHLIVHADSGIQSPADLRNKRVATPREGGGTYKSFLRVMDYYGFDSKTTTVVAIADDAKREAQFKNGEVDAIFYVTGIGQPFLRQFLKTANARLVPFTQYDAMRLSLPTVFSYTIPTGTYSAANPAIPDSDLVTIGVPTVLFVNEEVDSSVVREITSILFENKGNISIITPLGAFTSMPDEKQGFVPRVHPGALAYYNRDQPSFFQRYYREISFVVTILPLIVSVFFALRARLATQQRNRAYRYNLQMASLLAQFMSSPSSSGAKEVELRLLKTLEDVIHDMNNGEVDYSELQAFSFVWDKAMEAVRLQSHKDANETPL